MLCKYVLLLCTRPWWGNNNAYTTYCRLNRSYNDTFIDNTRAYVFIRLLLNIIECKNKAGWLGMLRFGLNESISVYYYRTYSVIFILRAVCSMWRIFCLKHLPKLVLIYLILVEIPLKPITRLVSHKNANSCPLNDWEFMKMQSLVLARSLFHSVSLSLRCSFPPSLLCTHTHI